MKNNADISEDDVQGHAKLNVVLPYYLIHSFLDICSSYLKIYAHSIYVNAYSSVIHNHQQLEVTMCFPGDKLTWYIRTMKCYLAIKT